MADTEALPVGRVHTRRPRLNRVVGEILSWVFLVVSAVIMLAPLLWMVVGGFKEQWEIMAATPAVWLPNNWRYDNYLYVIERSPLVVGYLNSSIIVPIVTVIQVCTSVVAGYAFAKLRFPGRDLLFVGVLSTLMLPGFLIQIPLFVLVVQLGWLNTYQAMIVPFIFSAFGIFLMRQFMLGVPTEYIDSARIDGSSEIGIIWRIVFPLTKEASAALAIFVFIFHWNELFWPLLVLRQRPMFTLPLSLFALQGDYGDYYHHVLAGATLAVIPVVIVYLVLQEHIIKGVTLTGLKG
ncbi:MAG: carbohydrate ABC transporter permease [Chloroflexota bacterium]|nr:MAG: carbohydrate ABC transporter permease [Chloroflexota bacterium]